MVQDQPSALLISNLGKTFQNNFRAIDNVNLDIRDGEVFGLLGPNGAGKTTTMRIISCLLRPTNGDVLVNGKSVLDLQNRSQICKEIGLLTESPNLYERLTAEQNLIFFARAYGVPESEVESRVDRILEEFDLLDRKKSKVGTFSRGMKQKLAIARVLVHRPSILLLDEPTSSLDAESAKSIRTQISETAREGKHTVLLSTHNLDDASRLCDRIGILYRGEILAQGTEDEISAQIRKMKNGTLRSGVNDFEQSLCRVRVAILNLESITLQSLLKYVPEMVRLQETTDERERKWIELSFDANYSDKDVEMLTARTVDQLVHMGAEIAGVTQVKPSLEEMFLDVISLNRTVPQLGQAIEKLGEGNQMGAQMPRI
jgi:ABC-type multidrug transport system ATPase subunit